MKVKFIILLAIIITTSCNNSVDILPFDIAEMQRQIKLNPDSIANILEGEINPFRLSDKDKADYWFLLTQTHLQQERSLINDSLILFSVSYYKKKNSPYLAFACRLAALQLNSLGDKNEEQESYLLQALKVAETQKDTIETAKTCTSLSNFYYKAKKHSKAIDIKKQIIELSSSSSTRSELMYMIGIEYAMLGKKDSCFLYLNNAIKIAKENNDKYLLYDMLRNYADCLNSFGDGNKAIEIINQANQLTGNFNNKYYLNFTSLNTWLNTNQLDSAKVCIDYLEKNNANIPPTDESYFYVNYMTIMLRAIYNEKRGLPTEILSLAHHGDNVMNIIWNNMNVDRERTFTQGKLAQEKDLLEIEKARQFQIYLIIIIVLLLISGTTILIYQRKILQKERAIQDAKERLQHNTLKLYENKNIIRENENLIRDLTNQIEENKNKEESFADIEQIVKANKLLQGQNEILNDEINKYSALIDGKGFDEISKWNIVLQEREKFLIDQLIMNHEVLKQLRYSPVFIKEEQWLTIINTVNVLYNNFAIRLQSEYPILTEEDIRYCCLIELHLSTSNIGILMAVSPTSVSKRKQRIKEKMTKINGGLFAEQSLENYLWNY